MHRILDKKKSLIICENNYKLAEISDFLESNSKESFCIFKEFETLYSRHMDEFFPNLEQVINIKTGPTSAISVALYPSFEEAETNLEGRAKMVELMEPLIREQFYHEGEITRNDIKG